MLKIAVRLWRSVCALDGARTVKGLLPLQHDGLLLGRLQDAHSDAAFSFLNSPNLQPGDRVSEDAPALEGEGKSLSHACCAQGSFKLWAEALRESSGTA